MSVIFLGDIHFLIHSSKLILKTILTRERCSTANPRLRCMLSAWHEITAKTKKGNRQQFVSYLYHLLGNFCNATTFGEMDSLDPLPRHPRAKPSCSNRMTEPGAGSAQVASTSGLGATKDGYCVKKTPWMQCLNYASSQRLRKACPRVLENVMVSFGTINCNLPIIRDGLRFRPHAILAECHLTGTREGVRTKHIWRFDLFAAQLRNWNCCLTVHVECEYIQHHDFIFLYIHLFSYLSIYLLSYCAFLYLFTYPI